jgi:hypothetical protein
MVSGPIMRQSKHGGAQLYSMLKRAESFLFLLSIRYLSLLKQQRNSESQSRVVVKHRYVFLCKVPLNLMAQISTP